MKSIIRTILLLFPALLAFSCSDRETADIPAAAGTLTLTPAVADMVPTKSRITVAENKISEASVALYHDGALFRSLYTTDMSAMTFENVRLGDDYTVYAAFNCGSLTFPVSESDLGNLTISWDASSIGTKGFPMTWSDDVTFGSDGQNVSMEATRLVSKVTLRIDNTVLANHNGSFTASSVTLKNSVRTAAVFDADIYGGDTSLSSDSATSADITSVNAGSSISFYTFENLGTAAGGVSVGSSDPWDKVPDNMSGKGDYCTYLEVEGTYSTDGGTCTVPVTYRMYIGENATSNFDLVRNYVYDVTMYLWDDGLNHISWKVTRGSFTDNRSLAFNPSSVTMNLGTSTTFTVTPYPSDMEYTVAGSIGWSGSTLTLTKTGNTNEYSLSSSGTLSSDVTAYVAAISWDGRVIENLPVTVKAKTLKSISISPSSVYHYTGDTETYTVTATYDMGGTETKEDVTSQATYAVKQYPASGVSGDVITMNDNVATALNGGSATITASFGGKTSDAVFNTRYPVSAVVKLAETTIPTGGSTTMTTTVTYSGDGSPKKTYTTATGLTYAFNPSTLAASISGNTVTSMAGADNVYVKATYSEAGYSVTSEKVKLRIALVTYQLSIDQGTSIKIGAGRTYNLTCTLKTLWDGVVHSTEDATNSATWAENSFGSIITVDNGSNKGQIRGNGYGTATVTATYNSQSASISVEVVQPTFYLQTTSSGATSTEPYCYIYVWVYAVDPFSGIASAVSEVGGQCTFTSEYTVQKSGGNAYMDFSHRQGSGSCSVNYTASYTGDVGGLVKYGTQTVSGTATYTE